LKQIPFDRLQLIGNFGLVFALFLGFDGRFRSITSVNHEASVAIDSTALAMSQML